MANRWLRTGERFRLVEGGDLWEVERVNDCAATVRALHTKPVPVTIGARTFMAKKGRRMTISPTSFVLREAS